MPGERSFTPSFSAVEDLQAMRDLGLLNDFPVAAAEDIRPFEDLYGIRFGPRWLQLSHVEPQVFAAACSAGRGFAAFSAEEVFFNGDKTMLLWLRSECQRRQYGLYENSSSVLRGLYLVNSGNRGFTIPIPSRDGYAGCLLVDLPFACKDGNMTIRGTQEGRTESFDFPSATCKIMHWFRDTSVAIHLTARASRAFLVYDLGPQRAPLCPSHFLLDSNRRREIERQVALLVQSHAFRQQEPKTCYLPLLRMVVFPYATKATHVKKMPPACQELVGNILSSYEIRLKESLHSNTAPEVLRQLRKEGADIIDGVGGTTAMGRVLTPRYIKTINKLRDFLDEEINNLWPE